jgi:hypothetical protein
VSKTLRAFAITAAAVAMLATAAGSASAATNGAQSGVAAKMSQTVAAVSETYGTPVPANASAQSGTGIAPATMGQCPAYNLCLWADASFGGSFWSADFFDEPSNTWLPVGSSLDNAATSLWNYRDVSTLVAQYANGTGDVACIPPGEWYSNLADYNWPGTNTTMNNSITSYAFLTSDC